MLCFQKRRTKNSSVQLAITSLNSLLTASLIASVPQVIRQRLDSFTFRWIPSHLDAACCAKIKQQYILKKIISRGIKLIYKIIKT